MGEWHFPKKDIFWEAYGFKEMVYCHTLQVNLINWDLEIVRIQTQGQDEFTL